MQKIVSEGNQTYKLPRNENQAYMIAEYAREFMAHGNPAPQVYERIKLFHTDAFLCGVSALAHHTTAPTILRNEALAYPAFPGAQGSTKVKGNARVFGSDQPVLAEKAIVANCAAVREWDSNGTLFGFRAGVPGHQAGEFGHNDFYAVVIAAAQQVDNVDGQTALKAMILLDEIRGRLGESFSLKTYKIDHVVHGAVASAVVYGLLMGASDDQIESAIGMVISHYIPYRAIRAGKQLSDSKGSSAAISTEVAIMSVNRSMLGFVGPRDIFRNPEAIFRLNEPTSGDSPFDLLMGFSGHDFAIMGMHFKLGVYEHQSASALAAGVDLMFQNKFIQPKNFDIFDEIVVKAYQPCFGIIGDPAKRDPKTRQSADHSMVYILATLFKKAIEDGDLWNGINSYDDLWRKTMLTPFDYGRDAIYDENTRAIMEKIRFEHGGPEYDAKYPDGIPTSMIIKLKDGNTFSTDIVMYPPGHARNTTSDLIAILNHKFRIMGGLTMDSADLDTLLARFSSIEKLSSNDLLTLYSCPIKMATSPID